MSIQSYSQKQPLLNVNSDTITHVTIPGLIQLDSNNFYVCGFAPNFSSIKGLIYFKKDKLSVKELPLSNSSYPFGLLDLRRWELSSNIFLHQGGSTGPYNSLAYSTDYGEAYKTVVFPDAWSVEVLFMYENMVFLEWNKLKNTNKKYYMVTKDTFKTFIPLDWQKPVYGRTFFKKGNFWRIGKQMGSGVKEYSWGSNAEYFESRDNGLSWETITLPVKYNFEMLSPDTFYTFSRDRLYWSYNAGQTWDSLNHNLFGKRASDIWFANQNTGFAIMDGKRLYKTIDGGLNWELAYYFDCTTWFIDPWDENYILFHSINSSESNKDKLCIYRTTNGVSTPVGIKKIDIPNNNSGYKNAFNLYPNPANQSISLQTPNGENAALSIYNLMGQIQYQNPAQAPGTIDISHLAKGLYIFELRQGAVLYRQRIEVVN